MELLLSQQRLRALLTGSDLDTKFWPYALLQLHNAIPTRSSDLSPLTRATNIVEDFTNLKTFRCRVWIQPPGKRPAKLVPNSRKGLFLRYFPYTTRNILWYNPSTHRVKIATHARFDKGYNDIHLNKVPLNVVHLHRTEEKSTPLIQRPIPADDEDIDKTSLNFYITPFAQMVHFTMKITSPIRHNHLGSSFANDKLLQRAYIKDIASNSPERVQSWVALFRILFSYFSTTHNEKIPVDYGSTHTKNR